MRVPPAAEFPDDRLAALQRAKRLEWITVAYMTSAIIVIYLTLGSSQAMKAAWIEDLFSLVPPLAFLVSIRIRTRPPSDRMPWGSHRAMSVAYLIAAVALLIFAGEIAVIPAEPHDPDLLQRVDDAQELVSELDWRLHDVVVVLAREIDLPEGSDVTRIRVTAPARPSRS